MRKLFTMRGERGALAAAIVGVIIGALINVVGYSLGRAYVYRTPADALLKLPFQFLQAGVGSAAAVVLCFPCGLRKAFRRVMKTEA